MMSYGGLMLASEVESVTAEDCMHASALVERNSRANKS